ncbi:DUF4835 family protein [Flavobacterium sp.]|jgi:hypothetical protein|uniref:type IX secretion system protein PorD n=1 Tax=Flavobacterium sp. TaxID=239 RepID=UPI0025F6F5DD|nr:DUF4835 family protein [Flavobacterium sp.]
MRNLIVVFFFLIGITVHSQQLNCTVTVNSQQITNVNQQIFKTLQSSLTDFVNKTDWTGQVMKQNEKINCSIYINLTAGSSDQFSGTIQVQSSRPIFDSTYSSPIFNFNDKDFNFRYVEFENLIYNPNTFDSNLVAVIAYYCHIILGLDADSFVEQSGTSFLEAAQNIATLAQQSGGKGWTQSEGTQNRYFLITDLLSPTFSEIRSTSYQYHTALDGMSKDLKVAKEKIKLALLGLNKVHSIRPNAFLTRVFFDAKSDEIVSIFSGGPNLSITDLVDSLNRVSPMNSSKWSAIKY